MNDIIEVCAALIECCIFVRLCNGYLDFKNEKMKWLKTLAFYILITANDIIFSGLDGFENLCILILLVIFLAYTFIFMKGKAWEKLLVSILPTITTLPINLAVMALFGVIADGNMSAVMPGGAMRIPVLFFSKAIFFFVCEIISDKNILKII